MIDQPGRVLLMLAQQYLRVKSARVEVWPLAFGEGFGVSVMPEGPFKHGAPYGHAIITNEDLMAATGDERQIIDLIGQAVRTAERQFMGPEIRSFRFQKRNPKHLRKDKDNALQE